MKSTQTVRNENPIFVKKEMERTVKVCLNKVSLQQFSKTISRINHTQSYYISFVTLLKSKYQRLQYVIKRTVTSIIVKINLQFK